MTTELENSADPVPAHGESTGMAVEQASTGMAVEQAMHAAERLLTTRLGARVRLADPEDLGGSGRSTVLRVRVARSPFTLPRTLVVKHSPVPSPDELDLFAREAASCQLFNALRKEDRPGPELVAYDVSARLLVLEDLGRSGTVAGLLYSADPGVASRAEQALLDWAHALGRLHAATRNRELDFAALLRRLGAPQAGEPLAEHGRVAVADLPALLSAELGVPTKPEVVTAADRSTELLSGRRYRAFSPADLGPDNAVVGQSVRFIDFEGAGFRTVLLDAAQLRAPLPTSLDALALPPGMAEAMVSAWHAEVVGTWPELADRSVLARGLLDGQLLWTWLCTWWLLSPPRTRMTATVLVSPSGTSPTVSNRGGVLVDRWEKLAGEAAAVGATEINEHAVAVVEALRRRFRIVGEALPQYPVFR